MKALIKEWKRKSPGTINPIIMVAIIVIAILPSWKGKTKEKTNEDLWKIAQKICENSIILDAHIDWPDKQLSFPENISQKTTKGDFDFVRAKEGGLNAVLSVAYVNSGYGVKEGQILVDSVITLVSGYTSSYPDKFAPAYSPKDIMKNAKKNLLSLPLCLENGTPIGNDIGYLKYLKDRGIVYITLNHNKANQISDSNFDENRIWNGLSPFGMEVIR